jgi:hypothetical protein
MSSVAIKRGSDLRNLILQTLSKGSYSPLELLRQLQNAEVTESALKSELAQLIEERIIELSADRHIRVR